MFVDLDDAISKTDDVVFWEFDRPEKNPFGLFCQRLDDILVNSEMAKLVKITNYHLTDTRDFDAMSAKLVLHGTAVLITRALVPSVHLYDHDEIMGLEANISEGEVNQTRAAMNEIIEDRDNRNTLKILVVFPDGVVCNADNSSDAFPAQDQDIAYAQRTLIGDECAWWPGYWKVRIVSTKKKKTKIQHSHKQTIEEAMAGMKL